MNKFIDDYRQKWINFFQEKNHVFLEPSSLIPINDKSILWINSGVATLKKYFSGKETPPKPRIVKIQNVIRTNDIQNIGETARHHTFFEMFGNFSIGDYFKNEALEMAIEFLTNKKFLNFSFQNLYFTYYENDLETKKILLNLNISEDHILKMGKETNFWDMGIGPSGPSCEIFYDRGKKYDNRSASQLILTDKENDRFIEIWNIVFSEFENDGNNNYKELPQKNIDTGMGFERVLSIIENTPTNFETSLFKPIILKIQTFTDKNYEFDYILNTQKQKNPQQFLINKNYKIIADFIRTIVFALSDGAIPSSTGRGYVIRRLIRRSVDAGKQLGITKTFLKELVPIVILLMEDFYPKISKNQKKIEEIIQSEEETFNNLIIGGKERINWILVNKRKITNKDIFMLFDTYGLSKYHIKLLLEEYKISFDEEVFENLLLDFRNKSRQNQTKTQVMEKQLNIFPYLQDNQFIGYDFLENNHAKVLGINNDFVVFDKTPFYATSGGQIHDVGYANTFFVSNVFKDSNGNYIHEIINNDFFIGQRVILKINKIRRQQVTSNHSSIHIVFAMLEKYLKTDLQQVGSYVDQKYFRFDFTYFKTLNKNDLKVIENQINDLLKKEYKTKIFQLPIEKAKEMGIKFLTDTNYSDIVRVVKLGSGIIDLCGGTHVSHRSDIEKIFLFSIEKHGSGIFRISGVSGKDQIKRKLIEINQIIYEENIKNIINKIDNLNKNLLSIKKVLINKEKYLWDLKIISFLDEDYKTKILSKISKIHIDLNQYEILIDDYYWKLIKDKIDNSIKKNFLLEIKINDYDFKKLQKKILKYLNQEKEFYNLIVKIIVIFENKITVMLVLSKKFDNTNLLNKEIDYLKKLGLKGNGRNQLYVFGGKPL